MKHIRPELVLLVSVILFSGVRVAPGMLEGVQNQTAPANPSAAAPTQGTATGGPPEAKLPTRIRVGGSVEKAMLVHKVSPKYPKVAKKARIQGTVRLEAVISREGKIVDLKVLSGDPVLVKSSLDAVQKWRYKTTTLNGRPVEVVTEIDVNYSLAY